MLIRKLTFHSENVAKKDVLYSSAASGNSEALLWIIDIKQLSCKLVHLFLGVKISFNYLPLKTDYFLA